MTRLHLPPLGLGTAPLGGLFAAVDETAAQATLQAAWDTGLRFFDTAPLYGHGLAEERLGRFLTDKPRDSFVIATKAGRLLRRPVGPVAEDAYYKGTPPLRPVFDLTRAGISRSLEESLARLQLAHVDILHLHDPDTLLAQAADQALPAMRELRMAGLVRSIGVGMNQTAAPARFIRETDLDCVLIAGRHTLLDHSAAADLLPTCLRRGVQVIVGGVYNSGLLADPDAATATFDYQRAPPKLVERARALAKACAAHGVPLKAAALAFSSAHPAVTSVLLGARSSAEVADSLAMAKHPIPSALWADLKAAGLLPRQAVTP